MSFNLSEFERDEDNTNRIYQIVVEYGLPSDSLVGPQASGDAEMLVQHADNDESF